MPVRCEGQLEKCIDNATTKKDFQGLEQFLVNDVYNGISHKCSKQFLNKIDKLICQELDIGELKHVSTLFNILQKHGRNISILGEVGFPAMVEYGLIQKMVTWFEKAKEILESNNEKNSKFTAVFEDFFDILMVAHDANSKGKLQILENFILRTCALAADKTINIYIQQEAVRKLNTMFNTMPRDFRKKIISSKEMLHVMNDMGKRILEAGDYDLQVAITEALCRMTSEKQRRELASQWFSMEFVSNAFKGIKDSEFETDCRKFLNQVNGMLGNKRRVFTYPCLSAILDNHELQIPADDNLEEFWIDFNTGSRSVSFYVAADEEGDQWETVCIPEEEVETYLIEEKDSQKVLIIHLRNPISVGSQEGEKVILNFDAALEIVGAVNKVYGSAKCKGFSRKNTMSVAKTTVHVIFDESGSQVLVPESQMSPLNEKSKRDEKSYALHQRSKAQKNLNQKVDKVDFQKDQSTITPGKRKMSEASMIVLSSANLPLQHTLPLANTSTPRKCRVKMPLPIMSSVGESSTYSIPVKSTMNFNLESFHSATKYLRKNSPTEKQIEKGIDIVHLVEDIDTGENEKLDEVIDIVPDSQQESKNDKQLMSGKSIVGIKAQKRQACSVPKMDISNCRGLTMDTPGNTFNQASRLSDRVAKQRSFSSIVEMTSEIRNKQQCSGEVMEEQQPLNDTNKIPVKNHIKDSAKSRNRLKDVDEKISRSNKRTTVPNKPEMLFDRISTHETSQVNLRFSDLATVRKEDNSFEGAAADCDVSYSRTKNTKRSNHMKTEKKTKSKEIAEAEEMLINNISSRYKQNSGVKNTRKFSQTFFEKSTSIKKSGFSVSKKNWPNRSYGNLETSALLNITAKHLMDDVYNFNLSGFDEPTIKLGVQGFHVTKSKATTTDFSVKINHESEGRNISQKKQSSKTRRNKRKKHIFSDTDTECRGDDTKTDISWLRESNRKAKPQLVDYSRSRKQMKPKSLEASRKDKDSGSSTERVQKLESVTNKTLASKNQSDAAGEKIHPTRSKRPRRTAQAKKCYKELSSSETESKEEEESFKRFSKNDTLKEHTEQKLVKNKAFNWPKVQQHIDSTEIKGTEVAKQPKRPTKLRGCEQKPGREVSPLPSFESPASLEKMRCSENDTEGECSEECTSERASSLSPPLQELRPENTGSLGDIKDISGLGTFHAESTHSKQFPQKGKKLVFETEELPPVLSPISLNTHSSFTMSKKVSSVQEEKIPTLQENIYYAGEAESIKNSSSSRLSDIKMKDFSDLVNTSKAFVSPSQWPRKNREERCHKELSPDIYQSGPTIKPDLKRLYQGHAESDSDEENIKEETRLLPKKLFKTDDNTYKAPVSESLSTLCIDDGEGWDADTVSVGGICQKIHKEFVRKNQSRSKRIENFTKQSMKTAHEYIDTVSNELHKHRARRLENLHSCLIKELESFEKDSQALRNTEKEISNFSKKQCEVFSTYNKSEQQRFQNIKTSFEKNIYHTTDSEENIFISEMHQMKEDMKGIQERLLKEMHEEELCNVRKGLQSLFMAGNTKF